MNFNTTRGDSGQQDNENLVDSRGTEPYSSQALDSDIGQRDSMLKTGGTESTAANGTVLGLTSAHSDTKTTPSVSMGATPSESFNTTNRNMNQVPGAQ